MHLPNLGLRKGGWYKLESGEESLEWEALGRDVRERLLGSLWTLSHCIAAAIFLEKIKPLPEESALGKTVTPTCGILLTSILCNPTYHTPHLFFLSPSILTPTEKTAT